MNLPRARREIVLDGKYRLEERLGEGATGEVYRAVHLGLKKTCAVKLLKAGAPDLPALDRFRREAEALGRLRHPHVVAVTDFGIDAAAGSLPFLVMEHLDGISLADFCRARGPLPLDRALPLLEAIAAAVDAAHAAGVLHRDLKPGNVQLCDTAGGEPLVKVLDFGLAEISGPHRDEEPRPAEEWSPDGRLTATGSLVGTPLYVAPELIRQQAASRASDLYSFGVIAYEMLAGHPPFQGSTAEVLAAHLEAEPPVPAVPGAVWQVLRGPLRKDPARRPASAGDVVQRLRRAGELAARERWRATELPRRAGLAAVLALLALPAGLLLPWPLLPALDHRVQDLRALTAPPRPPDPRIVLLSLDDAGAPPLASRADEVGSRLEQVFAAGARGVAIDVLLHDAWSASPAFSDLVLRHPDTLTLAAFSEPGGRVAGAGCVTGLTAAALGPERTPALFGFVNLEEDADGVVRRGRLLYRDQAGGTRPSWAAHAAAVLGAPRSTATEPFWIDTRIDRSRYRQIAWSDLPAALERDPGLFRGRLVLAGVGGLQAPGDDDHRAPHLAQDPAVLSGLGLQALLVDTIAAGQPVREPRRGPFVALAALLLGVALAGILCLPRARPAVLALAAALLLYLALSFPAFWWAGRIFPVALPGLLAAGGAALALALRRRLPPAPEVSR
jgi:CHASE2 domain-containing sensor protein/tRNA A-37 threonylcarbamoyl transferase component Bud32